MELEGPGRFDGGQANERIGIGQRALDALDRGHAGAVPEQGHGGRSRDRRRLPVGHDAQELGVGAGQATTPGVDGLAVVRGSRTRAVPADERIGRPSRRAIAMAARAGIGSAELHGQIGPGHAEAVVAARVHDHVRAHRHVTFDAAGARCAGAMVVMRGGVELRRRMAARAGAAGRLRHPQAVRVVAVAARHAGAVHLALEKRPVLVHLPENLSIRVIELGNEQGRTVGVEQGTTVNVAVVDDGAPRVAARAHLDL